MVFIGDLEDENDVLDWMLEQKRDESIEEINRETLFEYISAKDFLAVVFCKYEIRHFIAFRLSNMFNQYD